MTRAYLNRDNGSEDTEQSLIITVNVGEQPHIVSKQAADKENKVVENLNCQQYNRNHKENVHDNSLHHHVLWEYRSWFLPAGRQAKCGMWGLQ